MKRAILVILLGVVVGVSALSGSAYAGDKFGQKHGKQKGARHADRSDTRVVADIRFSIGEVRVLRDHYAPRYRSLPPGLRKKLQRGGSLPPGWRKKFEAFPASVERQLVVLPTGYRRGVIDGHAVIYNPRTQVIVDLAVLF